MGASSYIKQHLAASERHDCIRSLYWRIMHMACAAYLPCIPSLRPSVIIPAAVRRVQTAAHRGPNDYRSPCR
ncbi:hypothetical protein O3P69_016567 [Scylla paramamosain]|uniref:Uncharacterized protein n=1 Tax=Scylla paramamosain TaxID=85552 RepID=A0AAW0SXA7_SCYPA